MTGKPLAVLFLCTGNSSRSIMAEALLNAMGQGRYLAYSAGSAPTGAVDPLALELLRRNRLPTEELHSKSWQEFAREGAPAVDFVIAVDDGVDLGACPVTPGEALKARWHIVDPSRAAGPDDMPRGFFRAFNEIQRRVSLVVALSLDKLDRETLRQRLADIGQCEEG